MSAGKAVLQSSFLAAELRTLKRQLELEREWIDIQNAKVAQTHHQLASAEQVLRHTLLTTNAEFFDYNLTRFARTFHLAFISILLENICIEATWAFQCFAPHAADCLLFSASARASHISITKHKVQ